MGKYLDLRGMKKLISLIKRDYMSKVDGAEIREAADIAVIKANKVDTINAAQEIRFTAMNAKLETFDERIDKIDSIEEKLNRNTTKLTEVAETSIPGIDTRVTKNTTDVTEITDTLIPRIYRTIDTTKTDLSLVRDRVSVLESNSGGSSGGSSGTPDGVTEDKAREIATEVVTPVSVKVAAIEVSISTLPAGVTEGKVNELANAIVDPVKVDVATISGKVTEISDTKIPAIEGRISVLESGGGSDGSPSGTTIEQVTQIVDNKVAPVVTKVDGIDTRVQVLEGKPEPTIPSEQSIKELATEIVEPVKNKVETVEPKVTSLESQVGTISGKVSTLESTVGSLPTPLTEEKVLELIQTVTNGTNTSVIELKNVTIPDINTKLDATVLGLNTLKDTKVPQLEQDVSGLKTKVSALESGGGSSGVTETKAREIATEVVAPVQVTVGDNKSRIISIQQAINSMGGSVSGADSIWRRTGILFTKGGKFYLPISGRWEIQVVGAGGTGGVGVWSEVTPFKKVFAGGCGGSSGHLQTYTNIVARNTDELDVIIASATTPVGSGGTLCGYNGSYSRVRIAGDLNNYTASGGVTCTYGADACRIDMQRYAINSILANGSLIGPTAKIYDGRQGRATGGSGTVMWQISPNNNQDEWFTHLENIGQPGMAGVCRGGRENNHCGGGGGGMIPDTYVDPDSGQVAAEFPGDGGRRGAGYGAGGGGIMVKVTKNPDDSYTYETITDLKPHMGNQGAVLFKYLGEI